MTSGRLFIVVLIISAFVAIGLTVFVSNDTSSRIDGVSLVAPPNPIDAFNLKSVELANAGWVAVIPYAFSRPNTPDVNFNYERQWWGEKPEGATKTIQMAQSLNLKVMLKPHVWVRGQGWAGDFDLDTEEDWQHWEKNYSKYILSFAEIAEDLNVELFCIGTELRIAAKERPEYWSKLIREIRSIYHGKITYAANWDNYQNIQFWDELDYIGIDAYFPLSDAQSPTVKEIKEGWQNPLDEIEHFNTSFNKPVLFTEFGFQSIDYNASGHWKYKQDTLNVNLDAQAHAYEGTYLALEERKWFAGGFLWKWHTWHDKYGGPACKRFTPQNKPAQHVIARWYK